MTTTQPQNASEWQLYRVLQRANLLQYYDTFIAQGGDDVQQLCEAGEDEFLEIMALVAMASKPLHVRRLQKALQEWVANPAAFQGPLPMTSASVIGAALASTTSLSTSAIMASGCGFITPVKSELDNSKPSTYTTQHSSPISSAVWPQMQPQQPQQQTPTQNLPPAQITHKTPSPQQVSSMLQQSKPLAAPQAPSVSPGPTPCTSAGSTGSLSLNMGDYKESYMTMAGDMTPDKLHSSSPQPPQPTPVLVENQINAIAESAAKLATELPPFEARKLNMKKQINREIMSVIQLSEDEPNRMEALRKYAAIYGRFDSKRKGEKPMSLHEISVNEAAAQLCCHRPTLLTRREDLFPLARQVVKNSGYQYSKGHSRASDMVVPPMSAHKRPRYDSYLRTPELIQKMEAEKLLRDERLNTLAQEVLLITQRQDDLKAQLQNIKENGGPDKDLKSLEAELEQVTQRHLLLLNEQSDIIRKQRDADRYLKAAYENEEDMPSGSSSPGAENSGDGEEFTSLRAPFFTNQALSRSAMQESLFDEGLRIAQQYGMADFAQELKQMHPTPEEEAASKPTENGQSKEADPKSADTNGDHEGSESNEQRVMPLKIAKVNGLDVVVKQEPDSATVGLNGS